MRLLRDFRNCQGSLLCRSDKSTYKTPNRLLINRKGKGPPSPCLLDSYDCCIAAELQSYLNTTKLKGLYHINSSYCNLSVSRAMLLTVKGELTVHYGKRFPCAWLTWTWTPRRKSLRCAWWSWPPWLGEWSWVWSPWSVSWLWTEDNRRLRTCIHKGWPQAEQRKVSQHGRGRKKRIRKRLMRRKRQQNHLPPRFLQFSE